MPSSATARPSRFLLCAGLLAALGAGPLAPSAPAQAGPVGETAAFAAQIKTELLNLKGALNTIDNTFKSGLDGIKSDIAAGNTTAAQAHESLFTLLDQLFADEDSHLKTFVTTIQDDASAHLQNMVAFPKAFVVGDGGLIDGAVLAATDLVHVATVKAYAKVHAFSKGLLLATGYDLVVDRRGQIADPMRPSDDPAVSSPLPMTMLRIDVLLAGSQDGVLDDGRICLAGTADPANGSDIQVTLTLPGHAPVVVDTTVDGATHRWKILAPAALPGTLHEGNYSIDVAQGGVAISDSIGVH